MRLRRNRVRAINLIRLFFVAVMFCAPSWSQTRVDAIEAARVQKEQELSPPKDPKLERIIEKVESNYVYRLLTSTDGFGIGIGGLVQGAGFAAGPRYRRTLFDGHLHLTTFLTASTKKYYLGGVTGSLSGYMNDRVLVDFSVTHSDSPEMPYYGQGARSRKTGRSDYRLETTNAEVRPAFRPMKHLLVGAIGSYQAFNVGPGKASQFISAEQQFDPVQTPGLDRQTKYLSGGGFVEYDWRDRSGDPTRGGMYHAEYTKLSDRDFGAYSFYRLNLDARQYIPLFNGKRVIALRGATWLTDTDRTQAVPFYMQPTLGGDTMRGFRPFRFYDNNAVLVQGEYRWEASEALDVALFADGGKVFRNWEEWNLHKLEGSFGFGLRFKGRDGGVAYRIDTGFSREGFQVWFRVNNPF